MVHSHNCCCYGNKIMFVADLHIAVNIIKVFSFAMKMQKWVPFVLLSATKYLVLLSAILMDSCAENHISIRL